MANRPFRKFARDYAVSVSEFVRNHGRPPRAELFDNLRAGYAHNRARLSTKNGKARVDREQLFGLVGGLVRRIVIDQHDICVRPDIQQLRNERGDIFPLIVSRDDDQWAISLHQSNDNLTEFGIQLLASEASREPLRMKLN